jgi:WD40 repeat protein
MQRVLPALISTGLLSVQDVLALSGLCRSTWQLLHPTHPLSLRLNSTTTATAAFSAHSATQPKNESDTRVAEALWRAVYYGGSAWAQLPRTKDEALIPPRTLPQTADSKSDSSASSGNKWCVWYRVLSSAWQLPATEWGVAHVIGGAHDNSIRVMTFAPAHQRLVTAGDDGRVRVFEVSSASTSTAQQTQLPTLTLHHAGPFADHKTQVYGAEYCADRSGSGVTYSVGFDKTLRSHFWPALSSALASNSTVAAPKPAPVAPATPAALDAKASTESNKVNSKSALDTCVAPVQCVALSPDLKWIVTGAWDGRVRLYPTPSSPTTASPSSAVGPGEGTAAPHTTLVLLPEVHAAKKAVMAVVWSSATSFFTAAQDSCIVHWHISGVDGRYLRHTVLKGHEHAVFCLDVFGPWLVSGGVDQTLRVWHWPSGECRRVLHGHTGLVWGVQVFGDRIVSCSQDKLLKMWSLRLVLCLFFSWWLPCPHSLRFAVGLCLRTLKGSVGSAGCMAVCSPSTIISGGADRTLRLWKPISGSKNTSAGSCCIL